MVFQRDVLQDLFSQVETHHNQPLWQAFCRCVDPQDDLRLSLASEYEIYFNFVFSRTGSSAYPPFEVGKRIGLHRP